MSLVPGKPASSYAKTKAQTSFTVNALLISAFVLATKIDSSLALLPKFKFSSHFCGCIAWFVSDLVQNQEDRVSCIAAQTTGTMRLS